jgi:NTE family protein
LVDIKGGDMAVSDNIGVVLSGGGARGVAHAAFLRCLHEMGLSPQVVAGSSVGAMAAALYAAHRDPEDICRFFERHQSIFHWKYLASAKPGILDAEKYLDRFRDWLPGTDFSDLERPVYVCVTDVLRGDVVYFSEGEVLRPILASAAVPGVFTPVEIAGNWYIDGGTMNNFPVEPIAGQCDILLGSYVSPLKALQKQELRSTTQLIYRASTLALWANVQSKFATCDYVFMPPDLWRYGMFDTNKLTEIYELAYTYAQSQRPVIEAALEKKRPGGGDFLPKKLSAGQNFKNTM